MQRVDELSQFLYEAFCRPLDPRQLYQLAPALDGLGQNIDRADNHLQRLAQVMAGHGQQRRAVIGLDYTEPIHAVAFDAVVVAAADRQLDGAVVTDIDDDPVMDKAERHRCAMPPWRCLAALAASAPVGWSARGCYVDHRQRVRRHAAAPKLFEDVGK